MTRQTLGLLLFALTLPLAACLAESKSGKLPGELVIETGYLACQVVAGECSGEMRCVTTDGEVVCVPVPSACASAPSCGCLGDRLCGERGCDEIIDGYACATTAPAPGVDIVEPSDAHGDTVSPSPDVTEPSPSCDDLGGGLCSDWVYRGPISTFSQVRGVWRDPDRVVWGAAGGGLWRWDGETLEVEALSHSSTVFATGLWGAGGVIWVTTDDGVVRRRGADGTWSAETLAAGVRLNAVRGASADAVWVVGDGGLVGHWDGASWTVTRPDASVTLTGVWAEPDATYLVGTRAAAGESPARAIALRSTDDGWEVILDVVGEAMSVWGDGATLWVGGRLQSTATLRRFDGATWTDEEAPLDSLGVRSLAGADGELWAAGSRLWRRDEEEWQTVPSPLPSGGDLGGVHAIEAAGAGVVHAGGAGRIFRVEPSGVTTIGEGWRHILGMDARGPDDIWIVGQRGLVAHWDGRRWRFEDRDAEGGDLRDVWRAPEGALWVVGDEGAAWRRSAAGAWETRDAPTSAALTSVWGWSDERLWATGLDGKEELGEATGVLLEWTGDAWVEALAGPLPGLRVVTGAAGVDAWAVGRGDAIYRYDGDSWTALALPVASNLGDAWSAGPGRLVAGGAHDASGPDFAGLLYDVDGDVVTMTRAAANEQVAAIWGAPDLAIAIDASSSFWVATNGAWTQGPRLHFELMLMPMTQRNKLASDGEHLWLFGTDGHALRSAPLSALRAGIGGATSD